jgi:F-type H+-transporting ATPase subunit b
MGDMINFDMTLFIQLVNFLVTVVVLNFVLIKPVRDQIAARSSLTASYTVDIEKFTDEASNKISAYETALSEARAAASQAREAIKAEGLAREKQLVESAHGEASAFLTSAREKTAKEAKAAMKSLRSQANAYAAQAMNKILG